jgi:P-loop containing NTP hydrolase pore-1
LSDPMKWLDFSSYRLEMKIVEFAGGHRAVMLRGQVDLNRAQQEALSALGFKSFGRAGGPGFRTMWLLGGTRVDGVDRLEKAFPQARRVVWEKTRVILTSPGRSPLEVGSQPAAVPRVPPRPVPVRPAGALSGLRRAAATAADAGAHLPPSSAEQPKQPAQPMVAARQAEPVPLARPAPPPPPRPLPPRLPGGRLPAAAPMRPPVASLPAQSSRVQMPNAGTTAESLPMPAPARVRQIRPAGGQFTRADEAIQAQVPEVEFEDDTGLDALHAVAQVNPFQARYEPESRIGKPIAMIPLNMAAAMKAALSRIVVEHGDIDRWIARRAKWSMAQLEQFVSPEQVDAVALMLAAIDRGEGSILADQTGLGKGRVLATVARICAVEGKRIVFLTEKANLFTDFWRDVRDTGSEEVLGAPFLLNGEATIVDQASPDGDLLFSSMKKPDLAKVIKQAKLPRGTRLMMATYSQFNRKNSPKIELLRSVADGAVVIRDESHNAAGDSNTAAALASALAGAIVVHSSATYARDARNMQSYGSVLRCFAPAAMRLRRRFRKPWRSRVP